MALTNEDLQAIAGLFQPVRDDIYTLKKDQDKMKTDLETRIEQTAQILRSEIQLSEQNLRNEFTTQIAQSEQTLRNEIQLSEQNLKNEFTTQISQSEQNLRNEFTTQISQSEQKLRDGFKLQIQQSEKKLKKTIRSSENLILEEVSRVHHILENHINDKTRHTA